MAIIAAWERRTRGGSSTGPTGSNVRRWFVRVDSVNDNETTIYTGGGAFSLPQMFAAHPTSGALLREIQINHFKGLLWEYIANYSLDALTTREQDAVTNTTPANRNPVITLNFSQEEVPIIKDKDGNAILNSADDPYDDPITRPRSIASIDIVKNFTSWQSFMFTHRDKTNSAAVTIKGVTFAANTLRFVPVRIAEERKENGQTFYPHTFRLDHRYETWKLSLLDKGSHYWSGGQKLPFVEGGTPKIGLLDLSGGQLFSPSPSTARYKEWEVEAQVAFAGLPGVT